MAGVTSSVQALAYLAAAALRSGRRSGRVLAAIRRAKLIGLQRDRPSAALTAPRVVTDLVLPQERRGKACRGDDVGDLPAPSSPWMLGECKIHLHCRPAPCGLMKRSSPAKRQGVGISSSESWLCRLRSSSWAASSSGKSPLTRAFPMNISIFAPTRCGEGMTRLLSVRVDG
jgi:hypothetical protein